MHVGWCVSVSLRTVLWMIDVKEWVSNEKRFGSDKWDCDVRQGAAYNIGHFSLLTFLRHKVIWNAKNTRLSRPMMKMCNPHHATPLRRYN